MTPRNCFIFFLVLCLPVSWLLGQQTGSSLLGTVTDSSGAAVPGVQVQIVETRTGLTHSTSTNEQGMYAFPALPVGIYRLEATTSGFKRLTREGITLDANQNARINLQLEIGSVSEEVTVTAEAPLVNTRDVQIGGLVDDRRVTDLPLNGRNTYDLAGILPGVSSTNTPTVQSNNGNTLNVNGSRGSMNTFLLDGAFNNDLWRNTGNASPNPEAVQQFRLLTSNFSAEFGRSPGAVVSVVTKSGTNDFHGSLFHFLRNSKLNARNYFQPTVAPLRQNQFGATVGGPVVRNKAFFFFGWQSLLIRNDAFINSGIPPTEAERAGDFSAAPAAQQPRDPDTGLPFANANIPLNRLDPVAMNIIDRFVPLPNRPDGRLEAFDSLKNDENQYTTRLDWQVSSAHKLYGTLFLVRGNSFDPFGAGTQVPEYGKLDSRLRQNTVVIGEDWIVSPTIINQARFSLSQRLYNQVTPLTTSWSDFGSNITLGAEPPRPPQIFVTGRWQKGIFGNSNFDQQAWNISDTVSVLKGSHSLKFGAWALISRFVEDGNWLGSGQVRFQPQFTGNVLADFMMGRAASLRQNNGNDRDFLSDSYHFFAQDDWQISPRVSLNLGLRYELNRPFRSHRDEMQAFRFGQQSTLIPAAPTGMLFPGDPGIPRGVMQTDRNDFGPRVGVAIDAFGNGKTAIRAGYGVYYAIGFANWNSNMQGQPFLLDVTLFGTQNLVDPWAAQPGGSPFPYTLDPQNPIFSLPVTANYMSENFRSPYIQQYSFSVEQQLADNLALTVAYVGNTSRKLSVQRDANNPVFGPGATAGNINARRPYMPGTFAQIAHLESAANAHYDSLQMTVNRRLSRGFTIMGNYTWSKSIDEISADVTSATGVAMVDSNNRRLERAVSNFDARHILNATFVWELGQFENTGWLRHVIGGWQANGILRMQSGSPVDLTAGSDRNLDGNNNDRPDLTGNPFLSPNRSREELIAQYYDRSAFAVPALGAVGTAGRNLLYGPGSKNFTGSLFKRFPIHEQHEIQFRAEFFNLFNWVNLGNPVSNINNQNAGRILSAGGPRIVQFALKYSF